MLKIVSSWLISTEQGEGWGAVTKQPDILPPPCGLLPLHVAILAHVELLHL